MIEGKKMADVTASKLFRYFLESRVSGRGANKA
jgi:hypothetical protein